MRSISLRAARRVLSGAGDEFGEPEPVVIAGHQRGTKPAPVPVAIRSRDTNPGVSISAGRVRAELGDIRLAPDGMGSWRCTLCLRYLRSAPSDDGRRTVLVERDRAADELCACQFG